MTHYEVLFFNKESRFLWKGTIKAFLSFHNYRKYRTLFKIVTNMQRRGMKLSLLLKSVLKTKTIFPVLRFSSVEGCGVVGQVGEARDREEGPGYPH